MQLLILLFISLFSTLIYADVFVLTEDAKIKKLTPAKSSVVNKVIDSLGTVNLLKVDGPIEKPIITSYKKKYSSYKGIRTIIYKVNGYLGTTVSGRQSIQNSHSIPLFSRNFLSGTSSMLILENNLNFKVDLLSSDINVEYLDASFKLSNNTNSKYSVFRNLEEGLHEFIFTSNDKSFLKFIEISDGLVTYFPINLGDRSNKSWDLFTKNFFNKKTIMFLSKKSFLASGTEKILLKNNSFHYESKSKLLDTIDILKFEENNSLQFVQPSTSTREITVFSTKLVKILLKKFKLSKDNHCFIQFNANGKSFNIPPKFNKDTYSLNLNGEFVKGHSRLSDNIFVVSARSGFIDYDYTLNGTKIFSRAPCIIGSLLTKG